MTDLSEGPVGPPSPFRVPQQSSANEPFAEEQSPYAPSQQQGFYSPDPQQGYPPDPQQGYPPSQQQGYSPSQGYSPGQPQGYPPSQPQGSYSPPPPQYGAAPTHIVPVEDKSPMIALICGVLSWLGLWVFTAIPAIIFGVKGRRAAREGRTPNAGMATAGLWLGISNLVLGTLLFVSIVAAIAVPVFVNQRQKGIDLTLASDMRKMVTVQENYLATNPEEMGLAVAATTPGGAATVPGIPFTSSPGNVIAVTLTDDGYCVTGYNKGATRAISPTASLVYYEGEEYPESGVGAC